MPRLPLLGVDLTFYVARNFERHVENEGMVWQTDNQPQDYEQIVIDLVVRRRGDMMAKHHA